tara:strand:+ start:5342 stop:5842 length:501 start_codon:yes stop_codon:yes gene_type:complete
MPQRAAPGGGGERAPSPQSSHYAVLGVSWWCHPEEIKKAFFRLARKHHPDKSQAETDEVFRRIRAAYDVLSDAVARSGYDQELRKRRGDAAPWAADSQRAAGSASKNVDAVGGAPDVETRGTPLEAEGVSIHSMSTYDLPELDEALASSASDAPVGMPGPRPRPRD